MLRQQEHHRDHSHHHYHYEGCEQEELHGASNTPLLSPTQRLSKTSLPARSKLVTAREPRPRIARVGPQQRGRTFSRTRNSCRLRPLSSRRSAFLAPT